jgi:hypothetical protein
VAVGLFCGHGRRSILKKKTSAAQLLLCLACAERWLGLKVGPVCGCWLVFALGCGDSQRIEEGSLFGC